MTDLRDKIAKIVSVGCMHHWHTKTIADNILALPEITDLQKKLDKQVGYKEDYRVSYMGAMDDLHQAEARFIEQRDSLVSVTKKLAKTEAKLAKVIKKWLAAESEAYDLRAALTPPADLVQQATKGNTSD